MRPLSFRALFGRLCHETGGLALVEFAFTLPIVIMLSLTGAELTNYITVKMRVSQLALQIADDAARMGSGPNTSPKIVYESDINDLFVGANLQSGELDLANRGRVILTSFEPMLLGTLNQNRWQRCYGAATHASSYGKQGDASLVGIGPAGRQVSPQGGNPVMFVELYYTYKPLVSSKLVPSTDFTEIASMSVRDRRDTSGGVNGVYPVAGVTASNC